MRTKLLIIVALFILLEVDFIVDFDNPVLLIIAEIVLLAFLVALIISSHSKNETLNAIIVAKEAQITRLGNDEKIKAQKIAGLEATIKKLQDSNQILSDHF